MNNKEIIENLRLLPHPEGGYYKELYKSAESIPQNALPARFKGNRTFSTSIYFMLDEAQISHLHRLKSDELWYHHAGSSFVLHIFDENGEYTKRILGSNIADEEELQIVIPFGCWFASELLDKNSYGLVSCVVSPGFEFEDFELAKAGQLEKIFPEQKGLLDRLTLK